MIKKSLLFLHKYICKVPVKVLKRHDFISVTTETVSCSGPNINRRDQNHSNYENSRSSRKPRCRARNGFPRWRGSTRPLRLWNIGWHIYYRLRSQLTENADEIRRIPIENRRSTQWRLHGDSLSPSRCCGLVPQENPRRFRVRG